jgi:hypothetical protein
MPAGVALCLVRGGVEPGFAVVAGLLHSDGLPYVALGTGRLDEGSIATEASEAKAGMLAEEGVGVVFAHCGRLLWVGVELGGEVPDC